MFSKEFSKSLHIAFDRRQAGDYGELMEIDSDIARDTIENAKLFVSEIEKYLIQAKFLPQVGYG